MYISGTAEMHYMYSFVYHSRSTFHLYHIHPRLRCLCSWQKCRIFLFFKILDAEVELLIFKETLTQGYLFQREREREREREINWLPPVCARTGRQTHGLGPRYVP